MEQGSELTEKAAGVFAFAAYHQLNSGQPVKSVIRTDGKGHEADPEAVEELVGKGLAVIEENNIVFTDSGMTSLAAVVKAVTSAARAG
jgi:hypothetical protein